MEHFGLRAIPRTWPPIRAPKDFEQAMTRLFLSLPPVPKKYLLKVLPGGGGWLWDPTRGMGMSEWTGRVVAYQEKGPSYFKANVMMPHPSDLDTRRAAISPWWGGEGVGIDFYLPTSMVVSGVIEARVVGSNWEMILSANGEVVTRVTVDPQNEDEVLAARDLMLDWYHDTLRPNRRDNVREELDTVASPIPSSTLAFGFLTLLVGLLLFFAGDKSLVWSSAVGTGYLLVLTSVVLAFFQRRVTTNYYVIMTAGLVVTSPLAVLMFMAEAIL